jgi:uncharacterized protein
LLAFAATDAFLGRAKDPGGIGPPFWQNGTFSHKEDLQRLVSELQYFQPRQLLVVGDMFHSHENKELEWFKKWRFDFPDLSVRLVKGNHDILHEAWYKEAEVQIYAKELIAPPFAFLHDLQDASKSVNHNYLFSGHIHPGVRLSGIGKQSLRFPCFYFTPQYCVLPAFSHFTGFALIEQKPGDAVFAIVNQSIVSITC